MSLRNAALPALLALTLAPLVSGRAITPSKAKVKDESLRPRFKVTRSFEPCVKVRRRMSLLGTTLTVGADYHVVDQLAVSARPPGTPLTTLARSGPDMHSRSADL